MHFIDVNICLPDWFDDIYSCQCVTFKHDYEQTILISEDFSPFVSLINWNNAYKRLNLYENIHSQTDGNQHV